MMDIYLVIVGFILHLILFASIFDIYFTSPLVHGMTPHSTPDEPPAKRLVLFVGDGLRADKLYELKEDGTSRAPYLRSILKNQGTWGVSHTRVPTESRPGHVAIIAGFYEDVSAVTKGWQENPVEFDSVFNQSRFTWSWGSPDILPMFAKGASGDHVFIHTYPPESEDFADSDASKLDTWVFDKVKEFLSESKEDPSLRSKLNSNRVILFLHLLGIDTNGHAHKPYSKEYLENIALVDAGIKEIVGVLEDAFAHDGKTAYVLTSDHGMTDWGSHGASHPDETLTPLLAWGAGVREARHTTNQQFQDNFLQDWHLEDIERHDVNQADIAPLMSSLIGVPFPLNSVGVLPVDYLNGTEEYKARSLLTNAKQIIAQYEVKENQKFATTFRALFRPFKPLSSGQKELLLKHIHIHMARNRFKQVIAETEKLISLGLDGLGYYQTYDRFFLGSSVTLSYLGWMAYILHILLKYHTSLATPPKPRNHGNTHPGLLPAFCMIAALIAILLALQTSPINYYIYALTPVPLWYAVVKRWEVFHQSLVNITTRHSLQEIAGYSVLGVVAIETLVLSLFYREVISVGLVGVALWPLCSGVKHRNKMYSVGWLISCLVLAVFPMLPVVGRDPNITLVVLAGVLLAVSAYILFRHLLKLQSSSSINPLLTWLQIALLLISVMVVYITWIHITNKEGVPLPNKIFSWTMLLAAFVLPSFSSVVIGHRLLGVALSLSTVYMLLSTSHEGLFCLCLCYVMFFWILCESNLNQQQTDKIHQVSFNEEANLEKAPPRNLALTDLRCAWIFVFFILAAFFGTGNIASINSFDPSAVYCFLTVFNPFIMGSLLLMKNVILFLLVACAFQAIHILLRLPTSSLYLVVLLLSDAMALHFFFLVRDSGSWLEIGTSISHYVIVMSMILFIMLLLLLARLITTLSWKRSFKKHHAR
ncbi:GPI ethanolamine phosphate transferase 1 isoform X3 [Strongylocentrotus purpuratus]|uniref:GPI ethanolamine phosphate transferase 1 n=1 Tax=Strongylocentrotus purpuratus TaxID=7668 RepID=A0A7M7STU3_STRPU|nr:GPI ethanolamine phosphate transferase 1 isoform X3 [Strongylocentrotus purpuratus]